MPTKTEPKAETLATIKSTAEFARALRNAYLFTLSGRDRHHAPALECIELSFGENEVTVVATDSYALCTEAVAVTTSKVAEAVTIHRDQVKQIMDALKGSPYATLTIQPDDVMSCRIHGANGNSIFETTGTKVAFPDWRRVITHCDNAPSLDCTIGFAPKQVARLAKIDGGTADSSLRFDFYGTDKPSRVTVGKVIAYQMPFRIS